MRDNNRTIIELHGRRLTYATMICVHLIVTINNIIRKFRNQKFILKKYREMSSMSLWIDRKGRHWKARFSEKKGKNERSKTLGSSTKHAPERGMREDELAGKGENEGTYDEKFQIHFRLLWSLQDHLHPFRPSLAYYSFPGHNKLYGIALLGLPTCFLATYVHMNIFYKNEKRASQLDDITFGVSPPRDTRYAQTFAKL